jgi:citrate lyase beta subunit
LAAALDAAQPVVLGINGGETARLADDARLAAHPGVAAVVLPTTTTSTNG